ncbi:MAG TPA: hypothetical protein VHR16_07900 [Candidatus Limnocylindrales bacterium]|nr:hypothetical protein [Candidatus Limnocylindrales bacterium]
MADLLRRVGEVLPWLAVGAALVGGVTGAGAIRRGRLRGRPDLGGSVAAATVLSILAGGVTAVFTAIVASSWGGSFIAALPVTALIFGLPVAILVVGASITGYAVTARLRPRGNATLGAIAGPLVLGAACLLAVGLVDASSRMTAEASAAQEHDDLMSRSTMLHVAADDPVVTVGANGLVRTIRLDVTLRSDIELALEQLPGKLTYPLFTLRPAAAKGPASEIQVEAPAGSPAVLEAGAGTTYDLLFDFEASGAESSAPGAWILQVGFTATDGQAYGVEAPIDVGVE